MRSSVIVLSFAVAVGLTSACSSSGGSTTALGPSPTSPTSATPANPTIVASSTTMGGSYGAGGVYFFSPTPDTVAAGTTVTFQFGSVMHNVHFDEMTDAPDSIASTMNSSANRTFTTAGTYNYHCTIHDISGVVVVR